MVTVDGVLVVNPGNVGMPCYRDRSSTPHVMEAEAAWTEEVGGDTHRTYTTVTVKFAELFTELVAAGDGGSGDKAARLRELLQG